MACFLVPTAEAIVTTAVRKAAERKETDARSEYKIPFTRKLKWLSNLLWGGSALLLFEHIWHGEIVPWSPFLTGAKDMPALLHEMATTGVTMSLLVTIVWIGMLAVSSFAMKRAEKADAEKRMEA